MTKEQFYKNCFTEQGKQLIEQEFNTPNTLKQYYKREDLDLSDIANWNQIVYIPKYGKVDTYPLYDYDENGEEIFDFEKYGEILDYHMWEIYSFWDIILYTNNRFKGEQNKPSIKRLYKQALNMFNSINSDDHFNFIFM